MVILLKINQHIIFFFLVGDNIDYYNLHKTLLYQNCIFCDNYYHKNK